MKKLLIIFKTMLHLFKSVNYFYHNNLNIEHQSRPINYIVNSKLLLLTVPVFLISSTNIAKVKAPGDSYSSVAEHIWVRLQPGNLGKSLARNSHQKFSSTRLWRVLHHDLLYTTATLYFRDEFCSQNNLTYKSSSDFNSHLWNT